MNKNFGLIAAGIATLALAGNVRADVTATQTKSTEALGTALSKTDWTKTLSFDKFDPSLGTLTGVCLNVDLGITSQGMITNNAQSTETFKIQANVEVDVTGPGGLMPSLTASASSPSITLGPGGSDSYGPIGGNNTTGFVNFAPSAAFIGSGTFDVTGSTLTGITILGGGGNITASQQTFAIMSASVFYKYTPNTTGVPEPGAVAMLMACGLTGAGFMVRRRRK